MKIQILQILQIIQKIVRAVCQTSNAAYVHILLLTAYCLLLTLSSCGYHLIGSRLLPFNSITIKQVQNKTYEPRLEEKLHNALSKEFITQGIKVQRSGGDVEMEATINNFELGAIGAIDDTDQGAVNNNESLR